MISSLYQIEKIYAVVNVKTMIKYVYNFVFNNNLDTWLNGQDD